MLELDATEVLELPVDELGLRVLADLAETREWNENNYTLKHHQARESNLGRYPQALNAIAEALGWLRAQGMTARAPNNNAADAIIITRWGQQALAKTTGEIRAINRIQQHLHPELEHKVRRQFLLGEYENAIFVAMKAVEVRVRRLCGFGDDAYGVDLMTKAFKSGGRLPIPKHPPARLRELCSCSVGPTRFCATRPATARSRLMRSPRRPRLS